MPAAFPQALPLKPLDDRWMTSIYKENACIAPACAKRGRCLLQGTDTLPQPHPPRSNPLTGLLDPRYSPPEELCMPESELHTQLVFCLSLYTSIGVAFWPWACTCSELVNGIALKATPFFLAAFPRAPFPLAAAALSPFAWFYGRPDLFDSYSVGVLLMQMAVPQLR